MKYLKFYIFIIYIFMFSFSQSYEGLENKIYKNLRCLVCQGQTIADSNSDFAQTIKSVIRDKLAEGMNEKQIYTFLAEKYGEWILFKPPFNNSYLLWILPYVFFVLGVPIIFIISRKKHKNNK